MESDDDGTVRVGVDFPSCGTGCCVVVDFLLGGRGGGIVIDDCPMDVGAGDSDDSDFPIGTGCCVVVVFLLGGRGGGIVIDDCPMDVGAGDSDDSDFPIGTGCCVVVVFLLGGRGGGIVIDDCPMDVGAGDCDDSDFPIGGDRDWLDVDFSLYCLNRGASVVDCSVDSVGRGGRVREVCGCIDCPVGSDDNGSVRVGGGDGGSLFFDAFVPIGGGGVWVDVSFLRVVVSGIVSMYISLWVVESGGLLLLFIVPWVVV